MWLKLCLIIGYVFSCLLLPQKKKSALFEVTEVVPVMTNNYEENILRGVRDSSYSLESSIELLQKDVVQLHAPRYQSMRRVSPSLINNGAALNFVNMNIALSW